jgi:hypothetical protein
MNDADGSERQIEKYVYPNYSDPAEIFHPYDPHVPQAARRVAELIEARKPSAQVEHAGSTDGPTCCCDTGSARW